MKRMVFRRMVMGWYGTCSVGLAGKIRNVAGDCSFFRPTKL